MVNLWFYQCLASSLLSSTDGQIQRRWSLPTRQYPYDIVGLVALNAHGAVVKLGLGFLETDGSYVSVRVCGSCLFSLMEISQKLRRQIWRGNKRHEARLMRINGTQGNSCSFYTRDAVFYTRDFNYAMKENSLGSSSSSSNWHSKTYDYMIKPESPCPLSWWCALGAC